MMNNILIVDDEPGVLAAFEALLSAEGYHVTTASRAEGALKQLQQQPPDLVVLDVCMPGMNGLDALRTIKQDNARLPVIVVTGQGTMQTATEATKRGAFEYHLKPFDPAEMLRTIERALEGVRLMQRHVALAGEPHGLQEDAMVGQGRAMQEVYKAIGRVAPTDAPVLIRGESGTGKELTARAIYQHSERSHSPLLILNCAAIPEALLESELFGHERGAFTGAAARRIGKFEQAHGATVLLDEIGDVPLPTQVKLLRFLQEKTFQRVGGDETLSSDVRVLAATNRDLEQAIAEGAFREDLFHRLNVVTIRLPALRQRREDIPRLIEYFVERFSQQLQTPRPPVAHEALELLCQHDWPGNVRELEHCLHRTLIFTQGHPIQREDLQLEASGTSRLGVSNRLQQDLQAVAQRFVAEGGSSQPHAEFLETAERCLLEEVLRRTGGNQSQAARLLGITRPTLHARIQRFRLRAVGE